MTDTKTASMKMARPPWLKTRLRIGYDFRELERIIERRNLHTVCREAVCPNMSECFSDRTATFLILGNRCSRRCSFCGVKKGSMLAPDAHEPIRVAQAVKEIGLTHTVITSVTRDDLPDGGARIFARTVTEIKKLQPESVVEVLIPDMGGSIESLSVILHSSPEILGHNIETIPRLYPHTRKQADYKRSLRVLKISKELAPSTATKSGLILGMGEKKDEVLMVMDDLREVGCDLLTIGQYLPPGAGSFPVKRYYSPREFQYFYSEGMKRGFQWVESNPLVRSSYHAKNQWKHCIDSLCGS
ncbi:MAG: lipoyl synthase [Thermodesulfobacteriota bacterium]|nr:lipoyl synthase [Thermodesulfobacteriota bacterium]